MDGVDRVDALDRAGLILTACRTPSYLAPAEVATELAISRRGVYRLIERGRLKATRLTERNLRSRAWRSMSRHQLTGDAPRVPEIDDRQDLAALHASFEQGTGMTAAEWECRWKADALEDCGANMRLTTPCTWAPRSRARRG